MPALDQRRRGRPAPRRFSDRTLTKKASLNAFASGLDFAARAVVGVAVQPILLHRLGAAGFGSWQVLQRLIGQANPATGRPGEALKWTIAHEQHSTDLEAKRRAVGSAVAVWVLFLPLLVVVGGVFAWFTPRWLGLSGDAVATVRIAAAILVADLVLAGLTAIPRAVLQGQNLGYKRVGLSTAMVLVGGALAAAAVLVGGGLVGLAVATLVTTLLSGALFVQIVRSQVGWFGLARPDGSTVRGFLGLSWWFLLWNVVMKVSLGADVVVLGIAGSATAVASYSLSRYIPVTIIAGITIVIFGAMPGLGGFVGAGDMERARPIRSETMAITWLLSTVAGAGILVLERSFLDIWVGAGYYPGQVATLLIVLMVVQFALIRVDSNIIDLTLDIRKKVLLGLAASAVSVSLAWILVARTNLGIIGLAIGFLVGRSIQSVAYPVMIGRLLSISAESQLRGALRPAITTAALLWLSMAVGARATVGSWVGMILAGGASVVVVAAVAFFGGLSAPQRAFVLRRVRRVVARS